MVLLQPHFSILGLVGPLGSQSWTFGNWTSNSPKLVVTSETVWAFTWVVWGKATTVLNVLVAILGTAAATVTFLTLGHGWATGEPILAFWQPD